ncbi:sex determination protein fruitless isoform X2 [Armigeres subalbatus]|uniref:sex determination protein fruitless isoform X2 n=1 Tax=Armigeres subalbatus TaxID=124917 RepID=UPI002ED34784
MEAKANAIPTVYPSTPPYSKGARSSHQYFSLRWNNYQSNMTSVFHELLETQSFVDVTLACEYNSLKAHKVVLSACSAYFQKILLDNPCKHPTIILPADICFSDLQFIIEFVYRGEIDVSEAELQSLLRTAEQLKIKGLCEVSEPQYEQDFSPSVKRYKPYSSRSPDSRHPPPPSGSQPSSNTRSTHSSSSQSNNNQSGQDSKSGHNSSGRNHSNLESIVSDNGSSPINVLESHDLTSTPGKEGKTKMTSLGMGVGINGSVMGVPMGYLDFAPEPPAPTATPVTEHHDISCAPSHDTRDLSNAISNNGDIRVKFETLRSLDPQDAIQLDTQVAHQMHAQTQQQQQQQQHIQHQQIMHQQQQTHLLQQQQQQQQQVHRQTPQPQQADHRLSPHQQITQQPPQHQQHVLLIDQQSQHSHHSTHSPASNASSTSSQHHPENLVTVASTVPDSIAPSEIKTRVVLKQEIMTEADQQTQQQHHQQQQMELEPDQSSMHGMVVTPEISGMMSQSQMSDIYQSDASEDSKVGILDGSSTQYTNLTSPNAGDPKTPSGPKTWTAEDMESALEALRTHNMSLTKASATYGIPSTTLWQRAHRLGIDTPKKEGPSKTWNEDSLNSALEALRTGTISANKASKAFGIPSSTLYKIARREGIRLAAPFNAAPTTWSAEDLDRALEAIRAGQTSVQKASTEFGIPTGTLYGRCKREGIELSRSNPTPWSEDAMMEALESVKQGHMSINQAAIHYNLPYSSLYGRFKRGKYDNPNSGNPSHSNHGAGGVGGGGNIGGIGGNVGASAVTMAGVTSSPQMEFKIEPQHNEHSPENTTTEEFGANDLITIFQQHYNPALTTSLSTSSLPPSTQTHHIVPSPSPVNIHIINSNHHHHQLQPTPPPPHQTVSTTHHAAIQGNQPQLIQHHIIPQQHHIIYQQPLQQIQQQPQYHPMYHIIKQENDRS